MWSCNHSVTITGSLCYMELVRCESLDWQHKLTYKLQIAFMQMTSYIEVVSAPSWSDGVRCVHAARVLCLLRCVCLVIDEPRARCCFQGMEVDCAPEDLSKCSYEERCLEVKDMRLEAEAVVNDVLFAVSVMHVSHSLTSGLDVAYINVETREGTRYCLELTKAGLRVSGANMWRMCSF